MTILLRRAQEAKKTRRSGELHDQKGSGIEKDIQFNFFSGTVCNRC